jgi:hypothetical protein
MPLLEIEIFLAYVAVQFGGDCIRSMGQSSGNRSDVQDHTSDWKAWPRCSHFTINGEKMVKCFYFWM